MSCCGKKREDLLQQNGTASAVDEYSLSKVKRDVYFEYTGQTGLTVIGSITRIRYRFNHKGDVQLIDYRDASGMMAVPMLRRMK